MTRRGKVLAAVGVTAGLLFVTAGVAWTTRPNVGDVQALLQMNAILPTYVEKNDFTWPRSWNDLRPTVVELYGPSAEDTLVQLQERVHVNWDLDLHALVGMALEEDRSGIETVSLRSGRSTVQPTPTELLYYRLRASAPPPGD